jgi:hypothetical protein
MNNWKLLLTLALVASLVCHTQAQMPAPRKPEDTIRAYFADLQKDGKVARHIHPDELARFKKMLMPWLRKEAASDDGPLKDLFGPDATLKDAESATPAEFMDAFMQIVLDQFKEAKLGEPQILGSVKENDLLHFVTRNEVSVQGVRMNPMEVISLRAAGSEWKLLLSGNLEGLAAAIAAQP